ncbi:MAG TPA: NifU family protein [Solirubrobacterales bacterium]|jgi:Fe-S cluster biogenesis protein NfuA|nr:NifU family protein [Solirubrobacterales bacterium]
MATATESLSAEVETALDHIRSRLRAHGGDAAVGGIEDGEVTIEWYGACKSCPAAALTFGAVIVPAVREVAGVTGVRSSRVLASPSALRRIEGMARRRRCQAEER